MNTNRFRAAVDMMSNAGKEASARGTAAMMSAHREKNKPHKKDKVEKTMGEFKRGELKSSSGYKVTNRKQAIAIGLSEQRKQQGQG